MVSRIKTSNLIPRGNLNQAQRKYKNFIHRLKMKVRQRKFFLRSKVEEVKSGRLSKNTYRERKQLSKNKLKRMHKKEQN